MGYETIKVEKEDRVATIFFDRMEKKNAANHQVFKELNAALTDIEEDASMRVVVLTGQDEVFSAGADVTGFDFQKVSAGMYFMELVAKTFNHFEYIPKPVVMAVNGIAYGFGTGITLTGDIVVASDRAKFSIREINHGAIPIETLTRGMEVMGKHRIAYLSLMANDITAEEAQAIGLVNTVVPHDQLQPEVARVCDKLKNGPPFAQAAIKRILNRKSHEDWDFALGIMPAVFATEDVSEARKAFIEKRKAKFTGE
jgi:enoyl-CoA hydratase/carnithine racemase